jgi:hypothetical protein
MAANQAIVKRALEAVRALARKDGEPGPGGTSPTEPSTAANIAAPVPAPLARCGSPTCAGCYSVGVIGGVERFVHPPKSSEDWQEWLRRWEPKGGRAQ